MNELEKFDRFVSANIAEIGKDAGFLGLSNIWIRECIHKNYAQNFYLEKKYVPPTITSDIVEVA